MRAETLSKAARIATKLDIIPASPKKKPIVGFFSTNPVLKRYLCRRPFTEKYSLNTFTTVHGHKLIGYDVILLDDGIVPFTVESYITRRPSQRDQQANQPTSRDPATRSFPDFAKLYDNGNFELFAETAETTVNAANVQLTAFRKYLHDEGGFAVIQVKDPNTSTFVAKRCALLPSTALWDWQFKFNLNTRLLVETCLDKFNPRCMKQFRRYDELKKKKLFYFKRCGRGNSSWKNFIDTPGWQMEVMLKKWRTDRALEEWGEKYRLR
jgi:hypothetical protein